MAENELTHKLTEILWQFQTLAPKTAQAAVESTRLDAYATLVVGVETLVLFGITVWVTWKYYWPWITKSDEFSNDGDKFFSGIILGLCLLLFGFATIINLLDPWTYIATQHPDLYLTHKVISAIGKTGE